MRRAKQKLLPIREQAASGNIAEDNIRLLNCWLGIATRDHIGKTFCIDCEFLEACKTLYFYLDGTVRMHPAARARRIMRKYDLGSEYLDEYEKKGR
jgi:hypothetical protein